MWCHVGPKLSVIFVGVFSVLKYLFHRPSRREAVDAVAVSKIPHEVGLGWLAQSDREDFGMSCSCLSPVPNRFQHSNVNIPVTNHDY